MTLDPTRIDIQKALYTLDPTRIDIQSDRQKALYSTNPLEREMYGVAAHGYTRFQMPFVTNVEGNLWHGGCESGLVLPDFFQHVISLYPWEKYIAPQGGLKTDLAVVMYDSTEQGFHQIEALAKWVASCVADGPTLVHCQAGLNRSSLVVARVLIDAGYNPEDAVRHMRESRSPAVLCNPAFRDWVLGGAGHPDFTA